MPKPKPKLTLEQQYALLYAEGPSAFLAEKGTDGKRLARCAFDGTHQPLGPFDATDDDALRKVVRALIAAAVAAHNEKFSQAHPGLLLETAQKTAVTLHTHSGRYLQAETQSRYFAPAGDACYEYLTSATALGMRSVSASFSHAPTHTGAAKLFISTVLRGVECVCIAELIARDEPIIRDELIAAGLTQAEFDQMRACFSTVLRNGGVAIDRFLPQMLWPTDDGDIALTAVPALPVYNAISAMHGEVSEGAYLQRASFMVGSGQAQNVSVAATSVAGNLPVLQCEPPRIERSRLRDLAARGHARALAGRIPREEVDRFFVPLHAWPNEARKKFLTYAARRHARAVLEPALELREAVLAAEEALDKLPNSQDALVRLARGEPLEDALATELVKNVVAALPDDRKGSHVNADWALYYAELHTAIKKLGD